MQQRRVDRPAEQRGLLLECMPELVEHIPEEFNDINRFVWIGRVSIGRAIGFGDGYESIGEELNKTIARFFALSAIWLCIVALEITFEGSQVDLRKGGGCSLVPLTHREDFRSGPEVSAGRNGRDTMKPRTMGKAAQVNERRQGTARHEEGLDDGERSLVKLANMGAQ